MRAVTFDVSVPRFLAARSLGRLTDAVLFGRPSGVSLNDVELPPLPGPQWARIQVLKAGICGTDIGTLTFSASPALEPFGSFPAVPGHEILGRVVERGAGVTRVAAGERVVVDPMLSCTVRGYPATDACPSCSAGRHSTCERAGEEGPTRVAGEPIAPGLTQGYHRSLPGGWAEQIVCHESQLFSVPDALSDRQAVLIEPLAVGMHAVLDTPPPKPPEGPVLVIGSGPIALGTIWALRAVGYQGRLVAQTKRAHEARLARTFGANDVVRPGEEARKALLETGARPYEPILGDEVYAGGGFPLVFDCVGSRGTLWQAMRWASARGRLVMLGCAARMNDLDLSFVWARELTVRGFVGYGRETLGGRTAHTFEITRDLLLETGAPVERMVTHVFPLHEIREALGTAANRGRTDSIKVLLDPTAD